SPMSPPVARSLPWMAAIPVALVPALISTAVSYNTERTTWGVNEGLFCSSSAQTPATCGVAQDVKPNVAQPGIPLGSAIGRTIPVANAHTSGTFLEGELGCT